MRPTLLTFVALLIVFAGHAQSPPGINYQGVARNTDGKPISLKDITIKINIVKDNSDGEIEYSEIHSAKTNAFGLFTLVIGEGSVQSGDFQFISWAVGNKWLRVEMDTDGGNAFKLMGSQQFMSVPYAFFSKYSGTSPLGAGPGISITDNVITNIGDADSSPTNEYNTAFTLGNDHKLTITDGGGSKEVDLSGLVTNGITQELQLTGNTLGLTNGTTTIDLTPYKDNTDSQDLTLSGNTLSLTNDATTVDLSAYKDNTDNQDLTLSGNTLSLTNDATPINLAPYLDNTDNQDLTLSGNTLSLTNDATPINLTPYLDNTDNQDLKLTGNVLSLTNDATTIDLTPYKDNTDNQDLTLSGNTLSLTNDATPINLTPYLDNTDSQTLSSSATATNRTITISGGNAITIDIADNDNSPTNEIQDLSLTGNTLTLSGDATAVNLAPYLDNTDNQQLGLTGNSLTLDNDATPVDLTPYLDNTDAQTLALSGTTLSIFNGNSVSLASLMDNTDSQDLSLTGNVLSLTGDATPVNLAPYLDNTDSQNLTVLNSGDTRTISISGGTGVAFSVADGDSDASNELQSLSFNNATKSLSISLGNSVTIPETQTINNVLTQGNDAGGQKITNLGTPTANSDAVTKQYVDNADAALTSRISANYAFKTNYTFNALLAVSQVTLTLSGESFDDFNVVGTSNFTAPTAGTYMFVLSGTTTGVIGAAGVNLAYNGTNYSVAVGGNGGNYNSTFMFRLAAGETVSVVATGVGVGSNVVGSFFGYKLL